MCRITLYMFASVKDVNKNTGLEVPDKKAVQQH